MMHDGSPPKIGRPPYRAPAKQGRNERCACGSGKKYKRCHLAIDEQAKEDEKTRYHREVYARSAERGRLAALPAIAAAVLPR